MIATSIKEIENIREEHQKRRLQQEKNAEKLQKLEQRLAELIHVSPDHPSYSLKNVISLYNRIAKLKAAAHEIRTPVSAEEIRYYSDALGGAPGGRPRQRAAKKCKLPDIKNCEMCQESDLRYDSPGVYVCPQCHHTNRFIEDRQSAPENDEGRAGNYQKIVYYNEYMDKFRMKKSSPITADIMNKLRAALRSDGITDFSDLDPAHIDKFLRKIGHPEYYYDKMYILSDLNGMMPPNITYRDQQRMQIMFREVESIWAEFKPRGKISFINYPYLFRKILELLGTYDEYLKYWKLTTSADNIRKLDKLWEKMCARLKYQFIPTYLF